MLHITLYRPVSIWCLVTHFSFFVMNFNEVAGLSISFVIAIILSKDMRGFVMDRREKIPWLELVNSIVTRAKPVWTAYIFLRILTPSKIHDIEVELQLAYIWKISCVLFPYSRAPLIHNEKWAYSHLNSLFYLFLLFDAIKVFFFICSTNWRSYRD